MLILQATFTTDCTFVGPGEVKDNLVADAVVKSMCS
jgi:hypothetical protein